MSLDAMEAEARFRALFEKGPIGVAYHQMIYDAEGNPVDYRFLEANESYLKLTGVDPRGRLVTEAFPGIEKDPFDWIGTFGRVARTGVQIRFEQYLQTNDRWYDCVGYQFKPDHFVAAFVEITARKKAELALQIKNEEYSAINEELHVSIEELQAANEALIARSDELQAKEKALSKSERKLETMLQNIVEGMVTVDLSGQIVYSNKAAEQILGIQRKIIGVSFQSRVWRQLDNNGNPYPQDQLPLAIALKEQKTVTNVVHQIVSPEGEVKWLSVNASPLFDSDGKLFGAIASFRDITELRKKEETIELNESRLQKLLDILQHPSETIQEFLDYSLEQAIKMTRSKIGYIYHYYEERKEFVLNTWSKEVMFECSVANASNIYSLEKTGIWGEAVRQRRPIIVNDFNSPNPLRKGMPQGHVPLKKFMTIPVFRGDSIVGVLGLANKEGDYGESDILQASLLMDVVWKVTERKRAEESVKTLLAEKELILKEVHHRIKNNMNTVYGLLSLQASMVKDLSAVQALEDAGRRVQSMMILYSKLYQAPDVNNLSASDFLPDLVDEIVSNFPGSTFVKTEKNIDDFELSAKKLQPLGIIINELITNCMKYAFTGRTDGIITVSAHLNGRIAVIEVADNGNGMSETVDFENSKGFGLVLVRELAKQLHGTIRIERMNGTRIILEFEQ